MNLIRAATTVLARAEGEDITVQEVADEAGQSLRTLYQYFESKDDLLLAVFEEAMRTYARLIARAIVDFTDPLERLAAAMVAAVRMPEVTGSGVDRGLVRLRLRLSRSNRTSSAERRPRKRRSSGAWSRPPRRRADSGRRRGGGDLHDPLAERGLHHAGTIGNASARGPAVPDISWFSLAARYGLDDCHPVDARPCIREPGSRPRTSSYAARGNPDRTVG